LVLPKFYTLNFVNNWDITHRVYEGLSVHLKPKNLIPSSVFFLFFFFRSSAGSVRSDAGSVRSSQSARQALGTVSVDLTLNALSSHSPLGKRINFVTTVPTIPSHPACLIPSCQ